MTDNNKFRDFVTATKFNLTLGGSHIAAIQQVKLTQELHYLGVTDSLQVFISIREFHHRLYVPGYWGCVRRGLIEELTESGKRPLNDTRLGSRLTKAGELTYELLIEAGLLERIDFKAMIDEKGLTVVKPRVRVKTSTKEASK